MTAAPDNRSVPRAVVQAAGSTVLTGVVGTEKKLLMTLQYKYFAIPANDPQTEQELNVFLRSVKVLNIHHEFSTDSGSPCWYARVEYLAGGQPEQSPAAKKKGKDYKEILPPEDFLLFSLLRDWRKKKGGVEQVPLYTILTNEQLAKIAGQRPVNKKELAEIEGIGESRIVKYGDAVLALVREKGAISGPK